MNKKAMREKNGFEFKWQSGGYNLVGVGKKEWILV